MQALAINTGSIEAKTNALKRIDNIDMLEEMLKENNSKFIVSVLHKFYSMFKKSPLFSNDNEARIFCEKIREEYTNSNTIRAYILGLKRIYEIGKEYGTLSYNPIERLEQLRFLKIPSAKENPKEIMVEKPKIDLLIKSPAISNRLKAIILFLANTGCRSSELLDLKKDCATFTCQTVNSKKIFFYRIEIYQRKTDSTKIVPVSKDIWNYVRDNINKFENNYSENINSEWLIHNRYGVKLSRQGLMAIIKDGWTKIFENDTISAHQFRHFFATEHLKNGTDIAHLSRLMGHKSINTTKIYDRRLASIQDHNLVQVPEKTEDPKIVKIVVDRSMEIFKQLAKSGEMVGRKSRGSSMFRERVLPTEAVKTVEIFGQKIEETDPAYLSEEQLFEMLQKQVEFKEATDLAVNNNLP